MKLKFKKFIYLVNDLTSLVLKKEVMDSEEKAKRLRLALIIVSIILALSLVFNFYFIIL